MKKNYHLRLIKSKKSYSAQELADLLNVHTQTVRDWRRRGLEPIDPSGYALYLGSSVKNFLQNKINQRRVKLQADEFYCFKCQAATQAQNIQKNSQHKKIGVNQESIRLEGLCVKCGNKVNKFTTAQSNHQVKGKIINSGLSSPL